MASGSYGRSRLAWVGFQLVLATVLAIALGMSAGTERYVVVGLLLGGAAVLLSALNWRRHLIPMIFAYVCIEGFVSLVFRQYRVSLLFKDFLIIVAYMSFLAEIVLRQKTVFFRGVLIPMAVLALLGIAQIFNPGLPNRLVGIVGFKILCFYMPLVFLGYYCFQSSEELRRFLWYLMALSVPVAIMAAWQYVEGPSSLTRFGGGFGIAVYHTPRSEYGHYMRAIGTFSSPGMLAGFAFCMVAICVTGLGMTRGRSETLAVLGCLLASVVTLLVSGTRGGFIGTTLLAVAMLVLMRRTKHLAGGAMLAIGAVVVVAAFLGQAVLGRLETLTDPNFLMGRMRMPLVITARALSQAPLGWGLGIASVGTRHVTGGQPLMLVENYLSKLSYEMGWFGLIAFLWLIVAVMVQGVRGYRQSLSPENRWIAGCTAVFLSGLLLLSVAGTALDKIPVNVYFWFFLGIMIRAPLLPVTRPTAPVHLMEPPRPRTGAGPQLQ